MKSRYSYRSSQALTTIEVVVALAAGMVLWFHVENRIWALVALIFAAVSLLAHFNRTYREEQ